MEAVQRGMDIARKSGKPFQWLTSTNKGAAEVCRAALRSLQVTEEELKSGYSCDPASKSDLRIVAKKGLLIRLTRNLDKQRGFVNGAVAEVWEALEGNSVFIAKLVGSGNLVLVHPMWEDGVKFLPCCYGYATTIRRAQGASLDQGCIYFDQKYRAAGRGYGDVAVSRYRSRAGVYLFGKVRRTDFLPVGEDKDTEVLQRLDVSQSSSEDDVVGHSLADMMYESEEELGEKVDANLLEDTSGLFGIDFVFDE